MFKKKHENSWILSGTGQDAENVIQTSQNFLKSFPEESARLEVTYFPSSFGGTYWQGCVCTCVVQWKYLHMCMCLFYPYTNWTANNFCIIAIRQGSAVLSICESSASRGFYQVFFFFFPARFVYILKIVRNLYTNETMLFARKVKRHNVCKRSRFLTLVANKLDQHHFSTLFQWDKKMNCF